MKNNTDYHIPVMLQECIYALKIKPQGVYVDVTFGGGGHSREIFKHLTANGLLIAIDQDPDAKENTWEASNFKFIAGNFAYLKNQLKLIGITKVDGILADLGVSSHQFDEVSRGFSTRGNARLDMRMNPDNPKGGYEVINQYSEDELLRVFRSYGEIANARRLVSEIIRARSNAPIATTDDLKRVGESCAPSFKENKYLAQVFQAVRIEVNDEMDSLELFLKDCAEVLKPGGRLVIMSYHSLEDRMVKNFMKRGSISGEITKDFFGNIQKPFTEIVRHPITANEEEIEINNRARSAKLRIAERNE